jgi:hypothetical protein
VDTPATSNEAAAPSSTSAQRRRRLLALLFLLLLLLLVQLTASVLRNPGQDLTAVTSAFAVLADGAGESFVISGRVTAYPACTDPAVLVPGLDRCLVYTVHNPRSEAITVTSISISEVAGPLACPGEHLDVTRSTFTGALPVPAGATIAVPGRPIAMRETAANQDGCRGATFTFTFTGTARNGAGAP